jgi:hypothetical protein
MTFKQKIYTVWVFFLVNIKRLFRDRLALFFTFLFPLIFLFVFGGLNSHGGEVSFNVAIINKSDSEFSKNFVKQLSKQKVLKVDKDITTFKAANEKMSRSELDATIELPEDFGIVKDASKYPSADCTRHRFGFGSISFRLCLVALSQDLCQLR